MREPDSTISLWITKKEMSRTVRDYRDSCVILARPTPQNVSNVAFVFDGNILKQCQCTRMATYHAAYQAFRMTKNV
jgi:hypothetical protein